MFRLAFNLLEISTHSKLRCFHILMQQTQSQGAHRSQSKGSTIGRWLLSRCSTQQARWASQEKQRARNISLLKKCTCSFLQQGIFPCWSAHVKVHASFFTAARSKHPALHSGWNLHTFVINVTVKFILNLIGSTRQIKRLGFVMANQIIVKPSPPSDKHVLVRGECTEFHFGCWRDDIKNKHTHTHTHDNE